MLAVALGAEQFDETLFALRRFLPQLLAFLAILGIGYVVARLLTRAFDAVLQRVQFDRAAHRGGVKATLARSGYDVRELLSRIVFAGLLLLVLQLAFAVFGPNPVSDLLNRVIAFLPQLAVAVVIIVVTAAIAAVARDIVGALLSSLSYGRSLATAVYALILGVGVFAALDQLQIAPTIVNGLFYAVLAIVVGVTVVAVGGGGIAPMRQRWEKALERVDDEADSIRRAAQEQRERRAAAERQERERLAELERLERERQAEVERQERERRAAAQQHQYQEDLERQQRERQTAEQFGQLRVREPYDYEPEAAYDGVSGTATTAAGDDAYPRHSTFAAPPPPQPYDLDDDQREEDYDNTPARAPSPAQTAQTSQPHNGVPPAERHPAEKHTGEHRSDGTAPASPADPFAPAATADEPYGRADTEDESHARNDTGDDDPYAEPASEDDRFASATPADHQQRGDAVTPRRRAVGPDGAPQPSAEDESEPEAPATGARSSGRHDPLLPRPDDRRRLKVSRRAAAEPDRPPIRYRDPQRHVRPYMEAAEQRPQRSDGDDGDAPPARGQGSPSMTAEEWFNDDGADLVERENRTRPIEHDETRPIQSTPWDRPSR